MALALNNPTDTITVPRELLRYITNDLAMIALAIRCPDSPQISIPDDMKLWAISQIIAEVEEVLYPA